MGILELCIGVLTPAHHGEEWEPCLEWALVRNGSKFRAKPFLLEHLSPLILLSSPAINTHILPKIMVAKWENYRFELLPFSSPPLLLYFVSVANKEQNEEKESETNVGKGKQNNRARGRIYSKKEVK